MKGEATTYGRSRRIVCEPRWLRAEIGRFLDRIEVDVAKDLPVAITIEPEEDGYVRVVVFTEPVAPRRKRSRRR